MAAEYSREHTKIAVARILLAMGWRSAKTTALEILTDILVEYIGKLGTATAKFANETGFAEPNLRHLKFVFRDFDVNFTDLGDYCRHIKFAKCSNVPQYPLSKENHFNLLDPRSAEAAIRPAHIHEYLPPMPLMPKVAVNKFQKQQQQPEDSPNNSENVFKKPSGRAPLRKSSKRSKRTRVSSQEKHKSARASRRLRTRY